MSDIPELFSWGRDGVPGEVRGYLNALDTSVRTDRGEDLKWPRDIGFAGEGVITLAEMLAAELEAQMTGKREGWPRTPHRISTWCYLLHAYCAQHKRPAPPALLRLTFAALGLQEGKPAVDVCRTIGVADGVDDFEKFLAAAAHDGEADSRGEPMSENALAKLIGVSRPTVARWRTLKSYQSRRAFVAYAKGSASTT